MSEGTEDTAWLVRPDGSWTRSRTSGTGTERGWAIPPVAGEAVFVADAAAVVWWAWHAEFVGPVGGVLSTVWLVLLIGLPWAARSRRVFGPVAATMAARLVRFGSYAVLCALIPVIVWLVRYGNARSAGEPSHAWTQISSPPISFWQC